MSTCSNPFSRWHRISLVVASFAAMGAIVGAADISYPDADAVVLIRNPVFQKALAAEVRRGRLPKEIAGVTASLTAAGVAIEGRYAGSYLEPPFAILADIRVPEPNRALVRLVSVRVYGVELRRLASIVVEYLMQRLAYERKKGRVVVRDRGRQSDGAHEIEVRLSPDAGWPDLDGIELRDGEACITLTARAEDD